MNHARLVPRLAIAALLAAGLTAPVAASPAATSAMSTDGIVVDTFQLPAPDVTPSPIPVHAYLPPGYASAAKARYPVLYVNDGQDAEPVALRQALALLASDPRADLPIVIAIDAPPDRLAAYGLSDRRAGRSRVGDSRFGAVGQRAQAYSQWLAQTLVPQVDARYRTRRDARDRAVLGWSLGGLNAFNLAWQYPDVIGTAGAFSPSFWVPRRRDDTQGTRLAQAMVDAGPVRPGMRLFVSVGTEEETDDRDHDGVPDAVDDARDLVDGSRSPALRGLRQLGYAVRLDYSTHPSRETPVTFALVEGGRHDQASWKRVLPDFLRWAYGRAPLPAPSPLAARPATDSVAGGVTGTVRTLMLPATGPLPARRVDVWLPPGYAQDTRTRYPVLYMHDGQNLFDPGTAYGGIDWDVDGTLTRLIDAGRVRPAIVVGVWNSPARFAEYMPQQAVPGALASSGIPGMAAIAQQDLHGDAYLRALVETLKPTIDRTFRTLPGRGDTFVMGSSMGGLASLYALARYPNVFGGAAALSTHWPAADGAMVDWFGAHLPDPRTHRLYMDHGDATLDAGYAPYQRRMDARLRAAGWKQGPRWRSQAWPGAAHSETAWRARLAEPLTFLLGR